MRRVGEAPRANVSYQHRPGVYAILPMGDGILLTYQDRPEPELQLPGGGIDPGESPLQALHREVFEETGWRITAPMRLGAYRRFVFMPEYDMWAEKVCHMYVAHPVRRIANPGEDGHMPIVAGWETAMNEVASIGDRMFVREYLGY